MEGCWAVVADSADARLALPIARRMSPPPAKTASRVLASGFCGAGGSRVCTSPEQQNGPEGGRFARGIRGRWFARNIDGLSTAPLPPKGEPGSDPDGV